MPRDKIPRVIAGTDTFVTDPEDETEEGDPPYCLGPDGVAGAAGPADADSDEEASSHWGQWLRPD
ncbi:hypothetical protein CFP65_2086 [Kitasatospora sp. MMS16-BH015]|uniref:hypothetical protein n=1 Tax=Kitasatospora sp. MMS16-BH015 TaxID=2018025 RepID=UPI000CA0ED57|nr:hypothetical protein [Kitasatospora sp. MMS16-BH015]AUG76944.1 hypothetical protein CFP65_2086 [Kitasatospora sp. MMS16-BH015]